MRILVVCATGTIGRAVVAAFMGSNDIVPVSRRSTPITVELSDPPSIRAMYRTVGHVDAVVSAAGQARFAPLLELSDADFRVSVSNELMGQINLVRFEFDYVAEGGSFTLTSGILARSPMHGSAAISLVNAGVEAFIKAASLEAPRRIRVNVVSPPWVTETLRLLGMDTAQGLPAASVARAYMQSVIGTATGVVLEPSA